MASHTYHRALHLRVNPIERNIKKRMDKSVGGWVRNLKWLSQYWIARRTVDCWIQLCQIAFNYMIWTGWCTILPTMRLLWLLVNNLVNQWTDAGAVASYSDKWVQRVRTKNARMHFIATTNQPVDQTCKNMWTSAHTQLQLFSCWPFGWITSTKRTLHSLLLYSLHLNFTRFGHGMWSNRFEWNGME